MIFRIIFVVALTGALLARAAQGSLDLVADNVQASSVNGSEVIEAKGNARFLGENMLLTADEIRYEQANETLTATGHISITRGEARLLADRLVYKRSDGTFVAENIRLGSYPYFAEGFSADGTLNEITVRRARVSYGEPGPWQPTLTADTILIAPGQRIRTERASAGIGNLRPLPFPKFQHEFAQPFATIVSLNGGYRRSLGVFAEGGLLIPVSPEARLGADLGLYSARGVMIGPSAQYAAQSDPDRLLGSFRSGYINDHGDKKTDLLGRPIPENRGFAEWKHQQMLAPNLSLNAQLNWWKDSEVVRDFRPRAFFPVQEPDTFVESVYTGANYFVSAFARFQPNRFHRVQERLPEFRFDLLPLALAMVSSNALARARRFCAKIRCPRSGHPMRARLSAEPARRLLLDHAPIRARGVVRYHSVAGDASPITPRPRESRRRWMTIPAAGRSSAPTSRCAEAAPSITRIRSGKSMGSPPGHAAAQLSLHSRSR